MSDDWQRGYQACADRVRAALEDGSPASSPASRVAEVREWAASRIRTWGEDSVSGQVLAEMLRILDGTVLKAGADRTWLDDCRADVFPGEPYFARVTHLPTGARAEASGATPEAARWAAERELGTMLVAKRHLTVNDLRRAHGLKPFPQDACVDGPAADLASEAGAL